jgi:hypothetical protein
MEMKDVERAKEEKKEAPSADAGEKTEEGGQGTEQANDVAAPVSENNADGKTAETEVAPPAPVEGEKKENMESSQAAESVVPPPALSEGEKKAGDAATDPTSPPVAEAKADAPPAEAAEATTDPTSPPVAEAKADAPPAEAAEGAQETSAMNCDKGQIQPGASTVRCT